MDYRFVWWISRLKKVDWVIYMFWTLVPKKENTDTYFFIWTKIKQKQQNKQTNKQTESKRNIHKPKDKLINK